MAQDGHQGSSQHAAHDSALSVGSADDSAKIRELESEVRFLAEKATAACMLADHHAMFVSGALSPNVAGQGKVAIR